MLHEIHTPELEELTWVVVHGSGVWHTGAASTFARVLSMAGITIGRDAYYYMRYDDSPERVNIPMMFFTVIGKPKINVLVPEELEPIGHLFDAIVVMVSTMLLHETSQRARLLDGAKENAVVVVNTALSPDKVISLIEKYQLTQDWSGKLVTIEASKYHQNIAFGLLGALAKGWEEISLDAILTAIDTLNIDGKAKEAVNRAYQDATVQEVKLRAKAKERHKVSIPSEYQKGPWDINIYRFYQKLAAEATTYAERLASMPRWEVLAPGLIEFGPDPGKPNIGFKTSFTRILAPIIDMSSCIDCKLCPLYCPEGSIDFEKIIVDYEYCKGCGVCAMVCPTKAIKMVSELERLENLHDSEIDKLALAIREYGY